MFDARVHRPNRSRQAGSMLLSICVCSSLMGAMLLTGGQAVEAVQADASPIALFLVDSGSARPSLPASPGPAAPAQAPAPAPPDQEANPGGATPGAPPPAIEPGGGQGSGLGSTPGGGTGSTPGATGSGPGTGAGPLAVHGSELTPTRRVEPRYPEAARALALDEQRCVVQMTIDAEGRPTEALVDDCPPLFQDEARRAAMMWRFSPMTVDGVPTSARFRLVFRFRLD